MCSDCSGLSTKGYGKVGRLQILMVNGTESHVLLSVSKEMIAEQMEVQTLNIFKTILKSDPLDHFGSHSRMH